MNVTKLFNVVGIDDMEGTVFCRCTTLEKANKAKALLEEQGWENVLEVVQDDMPIDVVNIDGNNIQL